MIVANYMRDLCPFHSALKLLAETSINFFWGYMYSYLQQQLRVRTVRKMAEAVVRRL